jgi:hypothetical protein
MARNVRARSEWHTPFHELGGMVTQAANVHNDSWQ